MSAMRKPAYLIAGVTLAALTAWSAFESGDPSRPDIKPQPKLAAYQDSVGIWTICDGRTLGVTKGMRSTLGQCETWLHEDAGNAGKVIAKWVKTPITQDQYDALVLFVGNLGTGKPDVKDGFVWLKNRDKHGNARHSTLLNKINAGKCEAAVAEFPKWASAGGIPQQGLKVRRTYEAGLFAKGCPWS